MNNNTDVSGLIFIFQKNLIDYRQLDMGINVLWITTASQIIFLMQIGFAFIEAGSVRLKNLQSILFKNIANICFATLSWWMIGYGLAFGKDYNTFLGVNQFIGTKFIEYTIFLKFLYSWTMACTAVAINASCVAERMPILGYVAHSIFYMAWVYPIIVHWTWGGGWLNQLGYIDYSGSGIILMTGGVGGLFSTWYIGPRIDRFSPAKKDDFKPNNITFCVLGSLIIWFSWYGFACGIQFLSITEQPQRIPIVGMNISLSAVGGALASVTYYAIRYYNTKDRSYSTVGMCNGVVAGLVSVNAGALYYEPWAAFVIGLSAGILLYPETQLLRYLKIDDPINAVSVYAISGAIGVIGVAFLSKDHGVFYGNNPKQIWIQLVGLIVICGWVAIHTILFMIILKKLGIQREETGNEVIGLDQINFGGLAYSHDNITIKAMMLVKAAEEKGIIKRMVIGIDQK